MQSPRTLVRRERKLVSEINVVPYIDVMLVLLIIFMVTAPLVMQGIHVELPQVDSQQVPQEDDPPVVVTIDAAGLLYLDEFFNAAEEPSPISTAQLVTRVLAVKKQRPTVSVLVKGDKDVAYGEVIRIMSALKTAGIPEVGLVTLPLDAALEDLPALEP